MFALISGHAVLGEWFLWLAIAATVVLAVAAVVRRTYEAALLPIAVGLIAAYLLVVF